MAASQSGILCRRFSDLWGQIDMYHFQLHLSISSSNISVIFCHASNTLYTIWKFLFWNAGVKTSCFCDPENQRINLRCEWKGKHMWIVGKTTLLRCKSLFRLQSIISLIILECLHKQWTFFFFFLLFCVSVATCFESLPHWAAFLWRMRLVVFETIRVWFVHALSVCNCVLRTV
jgi:hypothetical protein